MGEENEKFQTSEHKSTWQIIKEEIVHLRWRILLVACFLPFGDYYTFDFPASIGTGNGLDNTIQKRFEENGKSYTITMNNALYSVYSYPNTVLAIFGGLLIDKFLGLRKSMALFISLIFLGAVLFWIGVVFTNFPVMLIARILYGLGGESLGVSQSTFVARWFKGSRGIALAFGITISFARVGSSFNFLFSPMIAEKLGIVYATFSCVIAVCISALAVVILILADMYAENHGLISKETGGSAATAMKFSDILRLTSELWLICIICIFCYCAIFPFIGIAKGFFQRKFGVDGTQASAWLSLYQFASAGFSPIVGAFVDLTGRYPIWLCFSSVCFMGIHILLVTTRTPPIVLMSAMGIIYSFLVSGLWPSVPFATSENTVGFAYGLITALQNIGLATFPLITGAILDSYTHEDAGNSTNTTNFNKFLPANSTNTTKETLAELEGYYMTEFIFMGCAALSFIVSVMLILVDKKHGGILNAKPAVRNAMAKQRQEEKQALLERESGLVNDEAETPTKVAVDTIDDTKISNIIN